MRMANVVSDNLGISGQGNFKQSNSSSMSALYKVLITISINFQKKKIATVKQPHEHEQIFQPRLASLAKESRYWNER